jgi:hypothetical protein
VPVHVVRCHQGVLSLHVLVQVNGLTRHELRHVHFVRVDQHLPHRHPDVQDHLGDLADELGRVGGRTADELPGADLHPGDGLHRLHVALRQGQDVGDRVPELLQDLRQHQDQLQPALLHYYYRLHLTNPDRRVPLRQPVPGYLQYSHSW